MKWVGLKGCLLKPSAILAKCLHERTNVSNRAMNRRQEEEIEEERRNRVGGRIVLELVMFVT
jgi:hypothetical protein